jgi:hypothetical protein
MSKSLASRAEPALSIRALATRYGVFPEACSSQTNAKSAAEIALRRIPSKCTSPETQSERSAGPIRASSSAPFPAKETGAPKAQIESAIPAPRIRLTSNFWALPVNVAAPTFEIANWLTDSCLLVMPSGG